MTTLSSVFLIEYGSNEINSKSELDDGNTPIISSQGINNGCYDFCDVKKKYNKPVISVPRTGSIGEAFVQLHPCDIDDNCLVMIPKNKLSLDYLFYIVNKIRNEKWRYLYGRQITPTRIGKMKIIKPNSFVHDVQYSKLNKKLKPKKNTVCKLSIPNLKMKEFQITDLFELERGDFHAINQLKKGTCLTISRVSEDNGLTGFYEKPKKAKILNSNLITISTVSGDAFLQFYPFIATDNVMICMSKLPLSVTSLIYIQAAINNVKWRYSYGRQPYKRILQKMILFLPVNESNNLDENIIEKMVKNTPYWKAFEKIIQK